MKQEATKKSKKWIWLVAALAAVLVIAGVVLALFLLPGQQGGPGTAGGPAELYFNIDREIYTKDAEMGFSTRTKGDDGLYHIRFAYNGEQVELPVSDKRLVNFIDTMDIVALVKDADGMIVDAKAPKDVAFVIAEGYYVKNFEGDIIQANSSVAMNGMDANIKLNAAAGVYDVTPDAEVVGQPGTPDVMDEIYVYGDLETQEVTHVFITSHPADGEVYWRVERFYDTTAKVTTRVPDANGVYTILFACNGEQVELKCKDPVVVTAIDSLSPLGAYVTLEFDEEGYIIDMGAGTNVALVLRGKQLGANYRVEAVDGNTVTATKVDSGTDQGKTIQFTYDDSLKMYLVDSSTCDKFVGEPIKEFKVNDAITVWGDLEGKPIYCLVLDRLVPGPMYFNIKKATVDAETGLTTRLPDEKGYYVFEMLADRELVTVRTKDIKIATLMDRPPVYTYDSVMGLELDGDIVKRVYDASAVSGMWPVGYQRYLTNQSGPVYTFAASSDLENFTNVMLASDVKIIDVSGADYYGVEMGSETKLNLWDRATVYRNIYGEANYIYVTHRYIEGAELYCVADRQWDSTNLVSKRQPDADGYYVFQLTLDGKQLTAKTKNKDLVQYIDKQSPAAVALKIEKGIIKMAYPRYSIFKSGAVAASWQYVDWIKKDGTFATWYTSSTTGEKVIGWPYEKKMAKDCKIYNISNYVESYKGEPTELRVGDQVQCIMSNMTGEVEVILVLQRYLDSPLYWNLDKQYDWTNMCSKRQPDADGYYVFDKLFANGEIKTLRTKSKEVADQIDHYSFAFILDTEGDLIKNALACMYRKNTRWAVNYYTDVTKIDGNKLSLKMNDASKDTYGETYEMTLAKDCEIWDVSGTATFNGKQATLAVGDRVVPVTNTSDEVCAIFIINKMTRKEGASSYCEHCGETVTWAPFSGYAFNADGHFYLPGDMDQLWQISVGAAATEDAEAVTPDVVLDLNGKSLTQNRRIFEIYGGTLTIIDTVGGGELRTRNEKLSNGAAIMIQDGCTLNLHAGTITLADEAVTNKEGGLVMLNYGGTFNMYGGTLTGGSTAGRGGNVFAFGGTFNMYGGTIENGAAANGANILAADTTLNGVKKEGVANIYGGTITDGGVKAEAGADLKLEGKPVIGGTGIRVPKGSILDIGTLKSGASIAINGDGVFAEFDDAATAEAYEAYFTPARTTDSIDAVGNTLVYTRKKADLTQVSNANLVFDAGTTKALCPVCGEKVTWTAIQNDTKYSLADGGHYYLPANVTFTDPAEEASSRGVLLSGKSGSAGAACLHLNGHNMTATNTGAISIKGAFELNIIGNGTVSGTGQSWSGNGLHVGNTNAVVNLIGGTYTKDIAEVNGTAVMIGTDGGTINMYNGAKIDATGKTSSNYAPALTLYGGGSAPTETNDNGGYTQGNNPALPAVFNMYGGQILGGTNTYTNTNYNNGGNVMLYTPVATMNILGGTVSGGEFGAGTGDVIAVRDGGTLIVSENATITAGSSGEAIGAVIKENDVTISGTVNGAVNFKDSGDGEMVFTGEPVVTGNVVVPVGGKITLTDLGANTSIVVKANGVFAEVADNATATTYADYLDVAKEGDSIGVDGSKLVYTKAPVDYANVDNSKITLDANDEALCPVCGEKVEWTVLNASGSNSLVGGHYIVPEGGISVAGAIALDVNGGENCLHLNGNSITSTGNKMAIQVRGASMLNVIGTGTVTGDFNGNYYGAAIYASAASVVNVPGDVTFTKAAAAEQSPILHASGANTQINLYGDVVVGAGNMVYSKSNSAAITLRNGGTVNMENGTVYAGDNTADGAGAVGWYTAKDETNVGAFNMTGGTIEACTVAGTNDYAIVIGTSYTSVTIGENAVVKSAGNAINQWSTSGDLTVSGHITGKVQVSESITLSGTPELNNLTLSGVKADANGMTGGKVYVSASDVFTAPFADDTAATAALAWFESTKADTNIEITTAHELKAVSTAAPVTPPAGLTYNSAMAWVNETEKTAWCPKCQTIEKWVELKGTGTAIAASSADKTHFYLSDNYTYSSVAVRAQDANACLHLNGHTLTSTGSYAIQANGKSLNIMGTGTVIGALNGNYGGAALMAQSGAVVNVYSDVIFTKAATGTEKSPVIHASGANSVINLEGNVTVGAADMVYSDAASAAITLRNGGTVNMKNGTVYAGNNTAADKDTGADLVRAGAVTWYSGAGTFNMTGGTIEACTVVGTNDYAILMNTSEGEVIIGENAVVKSAGNAINQWASSGALTVSGHVTGKVQVANAEKGITLSGTPEISNLTLSGVKADATGMTGGKVYVTASGVFTKPLGGETAATAALAWFESLTTDTHIATTAAFELQVAAGSAPVRPGYTENLQWIGDEANHLAWCPVCEAEVTWTGITQDEIANTTSTASWAKALGDGHYYLTENISSSAKHVLGVSWDKAACLHLNGKNITASGEGKSAIFMYYPKSLNIMGTGTVSGVGAESTGAALHLNDSNGTNDTGAPVINIYSGKFTKAAENTTSAIVCIDNKGGEVNMHGGQIGEESIALTTANGVIYLKGADAEAKFVLHDGTIYGAASANASAVLSGGANALFQMSGGTITSTVADKYLIIASSGDVVIGPEAELTGTTTGAINQWNGTGTVLTISGKVTGKVNSSCTAEGSVVLTGAPVLDNLTLGLNVKADVSGMTGGSVTMGTSSAKGVFTKSNLVNADTIATYFHVTDSTTQEIKAGVAELELATPTAPAPTPVDYAANLVLDGDSKAVCPVCQGDPVVWTALTGNGQYLENGKHYYVSTGTTLTSEGSVLQLGGAVNTCLHLNGGNITSTTATAITTYQSFDGKLNIMGTGTVSGAPNGSWTGAALSISSATNKVDIYGNVTFTKAATDMKSPVVFINNAGYITMNGGTIGAANLQTDNLAIVSLYGTNGAAEFTMNDGTIYGGTNTHASNALGDAVYLQTANAKFDMQGGTLIGGTSSVTKTPSIVNAKGTVIIGANATVTGGEHGALDVRSDANANAQISGTVTGLVMVNNTTADKVVLSGNAKLDNLKVVAGVKLNIAGLTEEAEIGIDGNGVFAELADNAAATAAAEYFTAIQPSAKLQIVGNTLYIHDLNKISAENLTLDADNKAYCPVCQATVEWTALTGNGQYLENGKHYYVPEGGITGDGTEPTSDDASLGCAVRIGGAVNTCVHLNGQTITSTTTTAIYTYSSFAGTLNIMGNGTISGTRANYWSGAALWLQSYDSIVNLYGNVKLTKPTTDVLAPVVYMPKGQVNMYGNSVIGEADVDLTTKTAGVVFMQNTGANDEKNATLTMYGGTIYGANNSSANSGSAITIANSGTGTYTFNMLGGNVYATDVAESDDNTIYGAKGCVINIGANATVGTTASNNTFYTGWVGSGTVSTTIAGTVEGVWKLNNITAASIDAKFVGDAKATLFLSGSRKVDLTGLTSGARITLGFTAHSDGIFTTGFATKEAAEAVLPCITPADGYQLSVTEETFQIQQTLIPASE